jgi:hypothetical protein
MAFTLYPLKGGGKQVWKLFPRIRREFRKPQGVIFGKRCGCRPYGSSPRWLRLRVRLVAASTRFGAEIEVMKECAAPPMKV